MGDFKAARATPTAPDFSNDNGALNSRSHAKPSWESLRIGVPWTQQSLHWLVNFEIDEDKTYWW